jgi:hypothetical protein
MAVVSDVFWLKYRDNFKFYKSFVLRIFVKFYNQSETIIGLASHFAFFLILSKTLARNIPAEL